MKQSSKIQITVKKKTMAFHNSDDELVKTIMVNKKDKDLVICPKCGNIKTIYEFFEEPYVTGHFWSNSICEHCNHMSESIFGVEAL